MSVNFRSKLHQALLAHYFSSPGAEYYLRELSRILSFDAAHLSRELNALSRSGIFLVSRRGREKYFRLNQSHPLYNEFQRITKYIVAKKATIKR
jgi:hypothetical protein